MTDLNCEDFQSQIAELALGVLDGRERAETIAHVDVCPQCRSELLVMGNLADRFVDITPAAEPPAGFETRVLARLHPSTSEADDAEPPAGFETRVLARLDPATAGRADQQGTSPGAHRGRRARRRPVGWLLTAAALAVAIGIGGWAIGRAGQSTPHGTIQAVTASFVSGNQDVGQLVVTKGAHPWAYMEVNTSLGNQTIICRLREKDGKAITVGSFKLAAGYGYWGDAIPNTASPITEAQLVNASGRTVAAASFPT